MARERWTDERLDDLADAMRSGFDRLDRDLRDARVELRSEIAELRQWIFRLTVGMSLGFISVLAAILARGG
jgi:hypothetical protein